MENLNNVPSTGTFGGSVSTINSNFDLVVNAINSLEYQTTRSKGILNYGQNPATVFPNAVAGDWCMILSEGNVFPATIKTFNGSTWSGSGTWNPDGVDLTGYAKTTDMTTAIANSLAQATARMGYGECTVSGTSLAVSIPNFILPTSGGTIHIKMSASGTGASTLNINSTGAKTLWYNGKAVSSTNTWETGEIISVFYDGTRFMASNAQGGGSGDGVYLNEVMTRTPFSAVFTGNGSWQIKYFKELTEKTNFSCFISCENVVLDDLTNNFITIFGYPTEAEAIKHEASDRVLYSAINKSELLNGYLDKTIEIQKQTGYDYVDISCKSKSGTIIINSPAQDLKSEKQLKTINNELYPYLTHIFMANNKWQGLYLGDFTDEPKVIAEYKISNLSGIMSSSFAVAVWAYSNEEGAQSGSPDNRILLQMIPISSLIDGSGEFNVLLDVPTDYPYLRSSFGARSGTVELSLYHLNTLSANVLLSQKYDNSPLIYGAVYDGIRDCSDAIQRALDNGGTIRFEGSGTALISKSLIIRNSNTSIVADRYFTFKLADNVNAPILMTESASYHSNDERVDTQRITNISISGGIWDLNHTGQTKASLFMYQAGFLFADIDNLEFHDLEIKNPISYGTLFAGINRFNVYNIHLNYEIVLINMDGIHLHGNCKDGVIENIWGNTHDDMVALNFDGDSSTPSQLAEKMLRRGDCYNIYVHNIFGYDTHRCIRLFGSDTYKIDNIIIDGIYGNYHRNGVISIAGWYSIPSYLGRVIIKNVLAYTKEMRKELINPQSEIINIGEGGQPCVIDSLELSDIEIKENIDFQSTLIKLERSDSQIKNLQIRSCRILTDDVNLSRYSFISGIGSIGKLIISDCLIEQPATESKINYVSQISPNILLASNCIFNATNKYSASGILSESNIVYNGVLQQQKLCQ